MATLTVSKTKVEGCLQVGTPLFEDTRGTFVEVWNRKDIAGVFSEAGLPVEWAQDNISSSHKNVVRGLHIQRRRPQGKLVRCVEGAVLDLCLDLRRDSPTFLKWHMERLEGGKALYLPPGCAHGFLALEQPSVVYYKCTTLYDKDSDGGVHWESLGKEFHWWRVSAEPIIMSAKDSMLPTIEQWLADPRGLNG